jgi:hypothetical protein
VTDRPGHDHRFAIDASKLEAELEWQAEETFVSGISKTVRWYLDNDWWWSSLRNQVYAVNESILSAMSILSKKSPAPGAESLAAIRPMHRSLMSIRVAVTGRRGQVMRALMEAGQQLGVEVVCRSDVPSWIWPYLRQSGQR